MIKKIIIIEGTDNTGKDTLIKNIKNLNKDQKIKEIHCTTPNSTHPIDSAIEQDYKFMQYVDNILNDKYDADILIFNRAWYGEFVYGAIYRGRRRIDVKKIIWRLEEKLKDFDITYIQLLSNNLNLLVKNDDGKSLAKNRIDLMFTERKWFEQIFNQSKVIKKKIIFVNNPNGSFRDKEEILKDAVKLVNSTLDKYINI